MITFFEGLNGYASSIEAAIQAGLFPPAPGFGCGGCEFQRRCLGQVGQADAQAA